MKRCKSCGKMKWSSEFYKKGLSGTVHSTCESCRDPEPKKHYNKFRKRQDSTTLLGMATWNKTVQRQWIESVRFKDGQS